MADDSISLQRQQKEIEILKECGISVAKTVSEIGETMIKLIEE